VKQTPPKCQPTQTIRDWVRRSNTWGPDGLKDCKASGQPTRLKDEHRRALIQMVEEGPNTQPCTG
jgi:transposase